MPLVEGCIKKRFSSPSCPRRDQFRDPNVIFLQPYLPFKKRIFYVHVITEKSVTPDP